MFKYENPFSLRRVVPCDGQTDKTKLIVAFSNSANAPNTDKVVIWYMTPCSLVICYQGIGEVAAYVLSFVGVK
jgi:hypothetical protein